MVEREGSLGHLRDGAIRAGLSILTLSLIYVLTPHVGFLHDGQRYAEMASDLFGNSIGSPWSLRIGIPALVAISPFSHATSFYAISVLAALAASLFVAATVAALGLPERHARAAAVLTCASQLTIICFWSYYIDLSILALYAAVVYFGIVGRHRLVLPLVAIFTPIKEIAILAGPLGSLICGRRRREWLWGVAATVAGLVVYGALNLAIDTRGAASGITPTETSGNVLQTQWDYSVDFLSQVWRFGIVSYTGNALLSVFGAMWLFWIRGYRAAPPELRRAVWWLALTLPVVATGQWERVLALYLPILVPLALIAIPRWRWLELGLLVTGSAWISGIAPTQTIADDALTRAATKLAWMSPGMALVACGFAVAFARRHRDSSEPLPGPDGRETLA